MSGMRKAMKQLKYIHVLTVVVAFLAASMFASAYRPTGSSTLSGADEFSNSSRFAKNYVFDRAFLWIPFAPVQITTTDGLVSIGTGAGTYTEVGTSEAVAIFVDTNNDTVGTGLIPFPTDIDLAKAIQCRVVWTQSQAAATGTVNWTMTYEVYVSGTSTIVVPDDTFDTDGGAQVDLGADVLTLGPWSTINGSTITATPGDDFFAVLIKYTEVTLTDAEALGVQCRYYRKWLGGGNS